MGIIRPKIQNKIFNLNQLMKDVELMKEQYLVADDVEILPDVNLEIGSRVEIISEPDPGVKGRIRRISGEKVYVNRDGYKEVIGVEKYNLINLSVTKKDY